MYCTNCGSKNTDQANFCRNCGKPLHKVPPTSDQPIPQPQFQQTETITQQQPMPSQEQLQPPQQSGYELPPFQLQQPPLQQSQPVPQTASQQSTFQYSTNSDTPKKKMKFLPWIITIVFLLAAAIIAGVLFLFPKKTSVLDNIIDALNGTLEAESLEFDVKCNIDSGDTARADGVILNDLNNKKLSFDINADTMEYILYKDIFIAYEQGSELYRQNLTDELKQFYDYLDEYQKSRNDKTDMDWKDLIRTAGLSAYINEDELDNCLGQLREKLNNKKFYQTVCNNFAVKKGSSDTEYYFDIDPSKMTEAVIEIMKPAINYDDIDSFTEKLTDQTDAIKDFTIKITIAQDRLVNLEFTYNAEGSEDIDGKIDLNIDFSEYNEASLDENRLNDLINADNDTASENPDASEDTEESEETEEPQADPTPIPTPIPDTIGAADLDLWYINYEGGDPVIDDSISRFMADYPQCNVNISVMDSSEYQTRLDTALAAGDMPDIFVTWADKTFYNYLMNGRILDISDYMQQDNYKDRFIDAGISQVTYQDRIYGVPAGSTSIYGFFYNKDIFNQYGLQEPTTIAELEQICDTLTANKITPFEFGNTVNFYGSMYFTCLAARKSGIEPLISFYEGSNDAIGDGIIYAGEKIQEWVRNGYFNEGFSSMEDYEAQAAFCSGNGAMYLNGSWSINSLQTEMPGYPDNVGFFAFPAYSENDSNSDIAVGTVGDTCYSVSSMCDNPEAAFKAITYLTDDTVSEQRIANNYLPPVKNFVPGDVLEQKIMEIVNNAASVCQIYSIYLPSDAEDVYYSNLSSLFDLSIGPEEFYDMISSALPDE